jgi:hypothetical protein
MATKRPSLFAPKPAAAPAPAEPLPAQPVIAVSKPRPPSRQGKRMIGLYLDPLAWKQLRQLALDTNRSTQALGEEALNLLFTKYGLNRSA